jgi:hypothetical protein
MKLSTLQLCRIDLNIDSSSFKTIKLYINGTTQEGCNTYLHCSLKDKKEQLPIHQELQLRDGSQNLSFSMKAPFSSLQNPIQVAR